MYIYNTYIHTYIYIYLYVYIYIYIHMPACLRACINTYATYSNQNTTTHSRIHASQELRPGERQGGFGLHLAKLGGSLL